MDPTWIFGLFVIAIVVTLTTMQNRASEAKRQEDIRRARARALQRPTTPPNAVEQVARPLPVALASEMPVRIPEPPVAPSAPVVEVRPRPVEVSPNHPPALAALVDRVSTMHRNDEERIREFKRDFAGTWWSSADARKAEARTLLALEHANIDAAWQTYLLMVEHALDCSPHSRSSVRMSDQLRRMVRWAALALYLRRMKDELTFGALDYALLSLPWSEAIGPLHPADAEEDPWAEFATTRAELPLAAVAPGPAPVSARLSAPAPLPAPALALKVPGLFHVRYWVGEGGEVASSESEEAWLAARRTGVTATDARMLVKLNGLPSIQRAGLLQRKRDGDAGFHFAAYDHGIDREPIIAEWVNTNFAISHNTTLCMGENRRHLATPDGVGDGVICEIKTSARPLEKTVRTYRDQLQWQLHVTGSKRVLFVVENRDTHFLEWVWVERDEERIAMLAAHADDFLAELDSRSDEQRPITPAAPSPVPGPEPVVRRVVRFEETGLASP